MLKLFCDLTNQCFAASIRDRTEPRNYLTEGNQADVTIYLVRPSPSPSWPFSYDPLSGSADLESPLVTIFDPFGATLTVPALLTPVRNGFVAVIDLATVEIVAALLGRSEREALLSVDAIVDTRPVTLFRGKLFLRPSATATTPTSSYELSGAGDPIAIIAGGVTDLAPRADFLQWFQLINVTPAGSPFTAQLTLDSALALPGATFAVQINIPASANPPIVQIFDNSVSGSLLDAIIGDTDNDVAYRFEAVLRPDHTWLKDSAQYL